ncbi:MAG TPA: flavodoxin [Candidatus Methanofastidiosa archaeon]|nr:flavodoxin [Candidatus Methanofastidiosa archaeon]HPR42210.1 flavodoxin [Candidatus Methanofastidiosa archaeon]
MRSLIVYYSRSGHTKDVAKAIAERVSGDIEEIIDKDKRSGPLGFVRSGRESIKDMEADIMEPRANLLEYDLVIVGTPVWASKMSTPVRAYLSKTKENMNNIAFFCTMNTQGDVSTLDGMEKFVDKKAVAKMSFKSKNIKNGKYLDDVGKFIDMIVI